MTNSLGSKVAQENVARQHAECPVSGLSVVLARLSGHHCPLELEGWSGVQVHYKAVVSIMYDGIIVRYKGSLKRDTGRARGREV
jgi:hypothetical protein